MQTADLSAILCCGLNTKSEHSLFDAAQIPQQSIKHYLKTRVLLQGSEIVTFAPAATKGS
jgi:hypothetical protein